MTADTTAQAAAPTPALKEIFSAARLRTIAAQTAAVYPAFDTDRFLALALPDLDSLELLQRLRHTTESLHATLPDDYHTALDVLRLLAPRLNHSFVSMILPGYVALYGLDDPGASLDALRFFTTFGSSEFGIRHFLRAIWRGRWPRWRRGRATRTSTSAASRARGRARASPGRSASTR